METQKIELNEGDIKKSLLFKTVRSLGWKYQIQEDNNKIHIIIENLSDDMDVKVVKNGKLLTGDIIDVPTPPPPLEVPRDNRKGAKLESEKASNGRLPILYHRNSTTAKSIQNIDKKLCLEEVQTLVIMRDKNYSDLEGIKKKSDELGSLDNFTSATMSHKEMIVLIGMFANKPLGKVCDFIYENYNHGFSAKSTLLQGLYNVRKYVMNSDEAKKFLKGEVIDMNYSLNYFKSLKNSEESQ